MATGEPPVPPCSCPQEGSDTQSDISLVVNSGIRPSDEQLLRLVDSRKPPASESMPSREYKEKSCPGGVRRRYCKREWFEKFPFSAFSHSCQGIFCLPCVLFPVEQRTSGRAQVLVSRPLVNWKDALADLSDTASCPLRNLVKNSSRC